MPYTRLFGKKTPMMRFRFLWALSLTISLLAPGLPTVAQQVMQIETYGKAKTKKIHLVTIWHKMQLKCNIYFNRIINLLLSQNSVL